MKRINYTLFSLLALAIIFSCTRTSLNYTQSGNWVHRSTFGGTASAIGVGYPACFVINNVAYISTGINPSTPGNRLVATWAYTPGPIPNPNAYDSSIAAGTWTQLADFTGAPRSNAIGFTAAGLGYVGTGLANDGETVYSDFYSYNPGSNQWAMVDSLADELGSHPRYDATSFSMDSVGYVLTGTDGFNYMNDVWKFSPATGLWTKLANSPCSIRSGAQTWVYQGQGYLLAGHTPLTGNWSNNNLAYDFWRFNPNSLDHNVIWVRLRDIFNTNPGTFDDGYSNIVRTNGAAFVIMGTNTGDKGYVTLGSNGTTAVNYTWEYDFASDLWTEKTPFEGNARTGSVGFTLNNRGFVTCGLNTGSQQAYTDCEEFFPNQVYNVND